MHHYNNLTLMCRYLKSCTTRLFSRQLFHGSWRPLSFIHQRGTNFRYTSWHILAIRKVVKVRGFHGEVHKSMFDSRCLPKMTINDNDNNNNDDDDDDGVPETQLGPAVRVLKARLMGPTWGPAGPTSDLCRTMASLGHNKCPSI